MPRAPPSPSPSPKGYLSIEIQGSHKLNYKELGFNQVWLWSVSFAPIGRFKGSDAGDATTANDILGRTGLDTSSPTDYSQ